MLCYYGDDMEEYRRWEDNIKMDLKEIGVNVRSWNDSAQDRDCWRVFVIVELNLRFTYAIVSYEEQIYGSILMAFVFRCSIYKSELYSRRNKM